MHLNYDCFYVVMSYYCEFYFYQTHVTFNYAANMRYLCVYILVQKLENKLLIISFKKIIKAFKTTKFNLIDSFFALSVFFVNRFSYRHF